MDSTKNAIVWFYFKILLVSTCFSFIYCFDDSHLSGVNSECIYLNAQGTG